MLRSNKTTQFDGTSYITDGEGNEQTVAYFSATIRTDKTKTAMGARLLRTYIEQPLIEKSG